MLKKNFPFEPGRPNVNRRRLLIARMYVCTFLLLMHLPLPLESMAAEGGVETSFGYDDNPARTRTRTGSAFTSHRLWVHGSRYFDSGAGIAGLVEGRYRNYTRVSDNWHLRARGEVFLPLQEGRVVPTLFLETQAYRDDYVREDEHDQYCAGLALDWFCSRRLSLSFEGSVRTLRYKHDAYTYVEYADGLTLPAGLFSAKGFTGTAAAAIAARQNGTGPRGGNGPGNRYRPRLLSRDRVTLWPSLPVTVEQTSRRGSDHLFSGDLTCELFLTPALSAQITAGYARLRATENLESFRQARAGSLLVWDMNAAWQVQIEASLARTDYDNSPLHVARVDHTFSAGLQLSRFLGPFEIFARADWLKNDSKVHLEYYRQMVTQCGFSWYF